MKILTKDLIGPPLDWVVQSALGWVPYAFRHHDDWLRSEAITRFEESGHFASMVMNDEVRRGVEPYSLSGDTVIDIMGREKISAVYYEGVASWVAIKSLHPEEIGCEGPTLRIAVCRAYVASKLGESVEVPDELAKEN